jgi:glutaredoxin-like protein
MSAIDAPSRILVYGTTWCGDCVLAKRVLDEVGASYDWIDIDSHPDAVDIVVAINGGRRTVPTIVLPDGQVLVEPNRRELHAALATAGSRSHLGSG